MQIIHLNYPLNLHDLQLNRSIAVAIGDFDGIHLGHQEVISQAIHKARLEQMASAIMTFNPHPREVLGNEQYTRYLTPFQEKMARFEQMGLDYCFVVSFDQNFAKVSPQDFVQHMLLRLNIKAVIVGFDFTFGHRGSGTIETLKQLCHDAVDVQMVKPYQLGGDKVSSSLIREQLHLGKLEQVAQYLGRHYTIKGRVVTGEGRGRTIGFPTANLQTNMPFVIPRQGVYAVKASIGDDEHMYNGVMNIGVKPTFSTDILHPTIEVHLLDFDEQIYDHHMAVKFVSFIREEQKFASVDSLIAQISDDITVARKILIETE